MNTALLCAVAQTARGRFLALGLLTLLATAAPAAAAELTRGDTGSVREIVDGDTLILKDGREIRLVGIQAPKLPLGRRGFREWPLAREAKAALKRLSAGRLVRLSFGGRRRDRHGRWLAHLHLSDEKTNTSIWLQGELLRTGLARVYSFADNRAKVAEMLALERQARAARRGIWAHDYYRILNQREAASRANSFQLVEGRVLTVAPTRARVFLNFGQNWRTDFTIVVARRHLRNFPDRERSLLEMAGKRVRVRGWLKRRNGPMITISHPEQIEVLNR